MELRSNLKLNPYPKESTVMLKIEESNYLQAMISGIPPRTYTGGTLFGKMRDAHMSTSEVVMNSGLGLDIIVGILGGTQKIDEFIADRLAQCFSMTAQSWLLEQQLQDRYEHDMQFLRAPKLKLQVKKLPHAVPELPGYQTDGSAGFDLQAAVSEDEPYYVAHERMVAIPTGLSVAVPEGYELQVRPRSGLAFKKWITVLNSPGTIDSDYRGEIMVLLFNHGPLPFEVKRGDRIAQAVLSKVEQADMEAVEELPSTERGANGFGSTGV
jgi:dUTP pyrophosphatase